MVGKLTVKQEAFCSFFFTLRNATQSAIKAGYNPRSAKVIASENLTKPAIISRLAQLEANKQPDPDVATVEERKKRLSQFIRAEMVDFVGADGDPTLSRDSPHHQAVSEYAVTKGKHGIRTSLKLRDPVAAIAELNKMDHVYDERPQTVNNTQINIIVKDAETKELVNRILAGECRAIE